MGQAPWIDDLSMPLAEPTGATAPVSDPLDLLSAEGRWQQDPAGVVVRADAGLGRLLGCRPEALCGHSLERLLGLSLPRGLPGAVQDSRAEDGLRVRWGHGADARWLALQMVAVPAAPGQATGWLGLARDITALVGLEDRLQRAERRLLQQAETASEGVVVVQEGLFRFVNQHLQDILGLTADRMLGQPFLEHVHPEDRELLRENHQRRLAGLPLPSRYEFRCLTASRGVRWLEMSGSRIDWDGRPATMNHLNDITDRKALEEQVRQLAYMDTLTGLANRRLLEDRLSLALSQCRRGGHHGALLYLDLDDFKPVNDRHGHAAGDQLLVGVAQRLRQAVRACDSVARLGGDEFVVMLSPLPAEPQPADEQAQAVACKLQALLAQPHRLALQDLAEAVEHCCTASIGVALFGPADEDPVAVLQRADRAMYRAKDRCHGRAPPA